MTVVLRKGEKPSRIKKTFNALKKNKGFNAAKHCGVLKLREDPLDIQKRMRDEWK
jgi:hypothetical protein